MHFLKQFADGNLHTQLLADFADEALLKRFARLAFAAGKFPQSAEVRVVVTLRDEQLPSAKDERRADFNGFTIHDLRLKTADCNAPPIANRIS